MTIAIDGKRLTSLVNNIELEYLNGFKPQASVAEPTQYVLKMSSTFSFSISCVTDSGYYAGRSTGDSYSAVDCQRKIDSFVKFIAADMNPDVTRALQHDVKSQPLYLYHNPKTYDSVKHSYCEACNSCSGAGQNTCHSCSGGYQTCSQCSSGYRYCFSCSGSGYRWENNRQISCGSCSGGQIRCHSCSGTGRTTCGYCSGRGQVDCNPCAATGYFTYWMSAEARSKGQQSCRWDQTQAPQWVNDYIHQTLSNHTHVPINRAVPWRFAEGSYQLEHTPFTVQVDGTLNAIEANVTVGNVSEKGLFLTPDTIEVWSLNHILDRSTHNISDYIHNNLDSDTLKKYLHTRMAQYALESINKPSTLPVAVTAPQLMSAASLTQVKDTIIKSAKQYDKVRNLISVGRWLGESVLCSAVLLGLIFGLNFLLPQANSTGLGLASFFNSVPTILEVLHSMLRGGLNLQVLWAICMLMPIAVFLMTLLGSGRAWSRLRLSYWFVISAVLALGLYGQVQTAVAQPVAANWWAFGLIPDVVLCGVLAGLFRARRFVFKNIGREVDKMESAAFARMLNYKE